MTDIVERLQYYTPYGPITDMQADAIMKEAAAEIERLREALKAFSCDCEENECAQWGEDGPRFDCVFRRYRGLVEKE